MKRWAAGIFAVALLALANTSAQAQINYPIVPPPEYDVPYKGEVTITVIPTQEEVALRCINAPPLPRRLGCAFPLPGKNPRAVPPKCEILIVPDKVFKGLDYTKAEIMRHELAHCNGWPGDHPGGKLRNGKLFVP
jgi:hypothetical protein